MYNIYYIYRKREREGGGYVNRVVSGFDVCIGR